MVPTIINAKQTINAGRLPIRSPVPPMINRPAILKAPVIRRSKAGRVTLTAPPGVQIHYTLDGSDPREVGGNVQGTLYTNAVPLLWSVCVLWWC